MKQEVLITLKGTQHCEGEEPETMELMTTGIMSCGKGKFAVSYKETALTGTEGVTSTFYITSPTRVVLNRTGAIESKMVFAQGERNESLYDLGFGALLVAVNARQVDASLTEAGGYIQIDYTVEVEQTASSHNTYRITVSPLQKH